MIRFLQTQGPAKKIILSGILLVICGAMVIAFIPGGLGADITGTPGKGIVAKVDGGDITADQVRLAARQMLQQQMPQGGANMAMLLPFFAQRAAEQLITRQALLRLLVSFSSKRAFICSGASSRLILPSLSLSSSPNKRAAAFFGATCNPLAEWA